MRRRLGNHVRLTSVSEKVGSKECRLCCDALSLSHSVSASALLPSHPYAVHHTSSAPRQQGTRTPVSDM